MKKNEELVRGEAARCFYGGAFPQFLRKEGCPGTFSQSMKCDERPQRIFLFVGFECDSLSERVEEGKGKMWEKKKSRF